jgi:hypothetical protein
VKKQNQRILFAELVIDGFDQPILQWLATLSDILARLVKFRQFHRLGLCRFLGSRKIEIASKRKCKATEQEPKGPRIVPGMILGMVLSTGC